MLLQDRFISTSELQQNVSKTIDKAKNEDLIVIRNNKLEAAIISIEKYNEFLDYLEWKKIAGTLDNAPIEYISAEEERRINNLLKKSRKEKSYTIEEIEKIAETGEEYK